MVVVRDDHNKFISKCNHVRRYRNSHRPARYLSVFLVLSTRQLKISTLFILVSPLVPETDPWASIRQFFNSKRINFYELFLKYCWKPNKAICEVPLPIPRYSQGIRGRDFRCILVVYLFRRSCLGFIASLKGQSKTWSTHRKSVMDEVVAHPPCEAVLKMRVDEGRTSGWCVCLKGSLQSGCLWPGALWWLPDRYRTECRENKASHQPA